DRARYGPTARPSLAWRRRAGRSLPRHSRYADRARLRCDQHAPEGIRVSPRIENLRSRLRTNARADVRAALPTSRRRQAGRVRSDLCGKFAKTTVVRARAGRVANGNARWNSRLAIDRGAAASEFGTGGV